MSFQVWRMDSTSQRWPIGDGEAAVVVTSPPYFGRRSYGCDEGELGSGESLTRYVERMVAWAGEARRVLADDGLLWLNIGDSAAKSGGAGGDYNPGGRKAGRPRYRPGVTGLRGPQYALVPFRVALALQDDGWLVRQVIVWDKSPVVRPEDPAHVARPLEAHEFVLMLSKAKNRFDRDGLAAAGDGLGNVWHFAPVARRRRDERGRPHLAPFPHELPLRCLRATGVQPGELVVDPFHGSGTTGEVARRLGCRYVGMDLYVGRDLRAVAEDATMLL